MAKIKALYKWLLVDTFPFPLIFMFSLIHLVVLLLYPDASKTINKFVSNILQFVGIIVVLIAVNDNVKIIDRNSIIRSFLEWLKACPLIKRNITLYAQGISSSVSISGNVKVRVIRKTKTLKGKVEYIFEEIKRLESEISDNEKRFNKEIEDLRTTMKELSANQNNEVKVIQKQLSEVFVGGAKEELFGVLCIFYSLIVSFFT